MLLEWYKWLAAMPYLSFAVVWLLAFLLLGHLKKASFAAMDVTFFVLVGSVFFRAREVFGSSWPGWLLIFLLLLAGGIVGRRQEAAGGGLRPLRIVMILSRTGFFALGIIYIVLLFI